jgi:hypothetical protein
MKKIGLICDLEFTKHMQFRNYYYALISLYGEVVMVQKAEDLPGLDILFIGGAFHGPHMKVFLAKGFIDRCNQEKIVVVLVSVEKILNSLHSSHLEIYKTLIKCDNLIHYTYDIEDTRKMGAKLFRLAMSRYYKDKVETNIGNKEDAIVFIGVKYDWRKPILDYVSENFKSTIYDSVFPTWEEYIKEISKFRFVLSPLGDADGLVTKFYEILLVHSIPIQQVTSNTLQYYDSESQFPDVIYFQKPEELIEKVQQFKLTHSQSEIWLEDIFEKLLKEDNLL